MDNNDIAQWNDEDNIYKQGENIMYSYSNFWYLKLLQGSLKSSKSVGLRIIIFYAFLYLLGIVFTSLDGSLYIEDDKIGYIEDIVNPFFMIALAISTYLVFVLVQKFKFTFWGSESEFDDNSGLNHAVRFTEEKKQEYRNLI